MSKKHEASNRNDKARKLDYRDEDAFLEPNENRGALAILRFRKRDLCTVLKNWPIRQVLDPSVIGQILPSVLKHEEVFNKMESFKSDDRVVLSLSEEMAIGVLWEYRNMEVLSVRIGYLLRDSHPVTGKISKFARLLRGVDLAQGLVGTRVNMLQAMRANELPQQLINEGGDLPNPMDIAIELISRYFRFRSFLEQYLSCDPKRKLSTTSKHKKRTH